MLKTGTGLAVVTTDRRRTFTVPVWTMSPPAARSGARATFPLPQCASREASPATKPYPALCTFLNRLARMPSWICGPTGRRQAGVRCTPPAPLLSSASGCRSCGSWLACSSHLLLGAGLAPHPHLINGAEKVCGAEGGRQGKDCSDTDTCTIQDQPLSSEEHARQGCRLTQLPSTTTRLAAPHWGTPHAHSNSP